MITKRKRKNSVWKKVKLGAMLAGLLWITVPVTGQAATINFNAKITALKKKFPDGRYWNHVGKEKDNPDGYTDSPCTEHRSAGVSHVYGTGGCTCNHFAGGGHVLATQCMGFANKLGYEIFGDTTWYVYAKPDSATLAKIKVGDIVRYQNDSTSGHSVFVIAKNGKQLTVGEANYTGPCQISWTGVVDLSTVTVLNYERANNYTKVLGAGQATEEPATTEAPAPYTGWKKAEDGKHYQYYKEDGLLTKQWITVKKKTYYVNKNGYRLTGLRKIDGNKYYFNKKGVLQREKWIEVKEDTYYVDSNGCVLTSRWLWHDGIEVYATEDGSIARNELVKIGKSTYYFNAKGKRSKGFKKCNGNYYYCNRMGIIQRKKWITKAGKKYYMRKSGIRAQAQLLKIGNYRYYFDEKGCMVSSEEILYQGKIYKADKRGRCKFVKYAPKEDEPDEQEPVTTKQPDARQDEEQTESPGTPSP
ncbi:MAG: hypothetical protein NC300_11660 [Bacteroidales bacterium]|nr:hypothetical protein [Clostridium sp.]MCM1204788.1 hypothetical protein [Bacteroidales bacterium]